MSKNVHKAPAFEAWLSVNGWSPGAVHSPTADGTSSETRLRLEAASELPPQLRGVFERHAGFVFRCLRQIGLGEADVDEALQRVFVLAQRDIQQSGEPPDRARLYAACRRIARGEHPAERRAPSFEPVSGTDPGALAFGHALVRVLSEQEREVFVLYEVEDLSVREIARALRRGERSVRAMLLAARERIVAEVERIAAGTHDE